MVIGSFTAGTLRIPDAFGYRGDIVDRALRMPAKILFEYQFPAVHDEQAVEIAKPAAKNNQWIEFRFLSWLRLSPAGQLSSGIQDPFNHCRHILNRAGGREGQINKRLCRQAKSLPAERLKRRPCPPAPALSRVNHHS
jgi:hypothetical protein